MNQKIYFYKLLKRAQVLSSLEMIKMIWVLLKKGQKWLKNRAKSDYTESDLNN